MLAEGLKLMILGMTSVMFFLTLMIFSIQAITWVNRKNTELELLEMEQEKQKSKVSQHQGNIPIVVFAAAIAAFENDRG